MQDTMLAGSVDSGTGAAKENLVRSVVVNKVSQGCHSRWWGEKKGDEGEKRRKAMRGRKKKRQAQNKVKQMRGILSFDFLFPPGCVAQVMRMCSGSVNPEGNH